MLRILLAISVLTASPAFAQEMGGEKETKGEIKFYVGDKDGKPVDLAGWTATLILEPKGMAKKTVKLELEQPKEKRDVKSAVDHGGQIRDMEGGFKVEMVVEKAHGDHEKEHAEKDEEEGVAHFEAALSLEVYVCPMKCVGPSEKPGKCSKCGMELKESEMEFAVIVVFKTKSGPKNAKGFEYPPAVPTNYPDAVAKMESHLKEIRALIDGGDLEKVHSAAEKISAIARKLPAMAPKDDMKEVEKACNELVALFKEIDDAADAGNKPATAKAYDKYKERIEILKNHAKGGDRDHDK